MLAAHGSPLSAPGAERGFELAQVFGKLSPPGHLFAGLIGMFEGQEGGVQGLARKRTSLEPLGLGRPSGW